MSSDIRLRGGPFSDEDPGIEDAPAARCSRSLPAAIAEIVEEGRTEARTAASGAASIVDDADPDARRRFFVDEIDLHGDGVGSVHF